MFHTEPRHLCFSCCRLWREDQVTDPRERHHCGFHPDQLESPLRCPECRSSDDLHQWSYETMQELKDDAIGCMTQKPWRAKAIIELLWSIWDDVELSREWEDAA